MSCSILRRSPPSRLKPDEYETSVTRIESLSSSTRFGAPPPTTLSTCAHVSSAAPTRTDMTTAPVPATHAAATRPTIQELLFSLNFISFRPLYGGGKSPDYILNLMPARNARPTVSYRVALVVMA
jgi:hypothetical protein